MSTDEASTESTKHAEGTRATPLANPIVSVSDLSSVHSPDSVLAALNEAG